jgi:dolichol-phosphate mannosyltransferase
MKISLILPVYNEKLVLKEVIDKYVADLDDITERYGVLWEIVAVDDGSNDGSVAVLTKFAKHFRNFKVVVLDGRYGKQAAVTAGFGASDGDCVIVADADLLNPAGVLRRLFETGDHGNAPITHGYREFIAGEKRKAVISDWLTRFATKFLLIDGYYNGKVNLAMYSGDVADVIRDNPTKNKYLRTMNNWVGWEPKEIWYESEYTREEIIQKTKELKRKHGRITNPKSNYTEDSASRWYGLVFLIMALIAVGFGIMTIGANVLFYSLFMFMFGAVLLVTAMLFFLRAMVLRYIGNIYYRPGEIIYGVKNVLNK